MSKLAPLLLSLALAAPAAAQGSALPAFYLLDASLVRALSVVERPELAGVFSYMPPEATPLALADLLFRDSAALKRYVRRVEKDAAALGGIAPFDKAALLYVVGMNALNNPPRPAGSRPLAKRWALRVSELSLKRTLTQQELAQARSAAR